MTSATTIPTKQRSAILACKRLGIEVNSLAELSADQQGELLGHFPQFRELLASTSEKPRPKGSALRVAFLTPGFWMGGAERWICSLARNFDPAKVVVSSVVVRDAGQLNPLMLAALPRNIKFYNGREHLPEAAKECDLLISWGCGDLPGLVAGLDIPLVDVHHAANDTDYIRTLVDASYKAGAKIVAVSDACKMQFTAKEWQGVTLIPNGADPDRVTPRKGRKAFRDELGVTDGAKLVLCASRIMPDKNISFLVDAVAELDPDFGLCLVGPQMHYSAQEVTRWKKLLGSRLIIRPEVHHIGDYLAAADCFALASLSEAHPLAVTESWLAGLPVAMFHLPWVSWIEEQHGKLIYDCPMQFKDDPRAFALSIFQAATDQKLRAKPAKEIAWQSYTSSAMAARWEEYLTPQITT